MDEKDNYGLKQKQEKAVKSLIAVTQTQSFILEIKIGIDLTTD
jgi:hypothetical protein